MRAFLAAMLLVGLSVRIANAGDKPPQPSTLTPDKDVRLAKVANAPLQKIGVLTYYPNRSGGYTFLEGTEIVFYALPYWPSTSLDFFFVESAAGRIEATPFRIIGKSKMALGCQTLYRGDMRKTMTPNALLREDTPIAQWSSDAQFPIDKWSRDTPTGKVGLLIMVKDRETRLKLKSIVPVLERARKPLPSKP